MNYTLENQFLSISISSHGGELQSIRTPDHTEYLWQGNPDFWSDRAPNIFPYVARLTDRKYIYHGNIYQMDIHGFLKDTELTCDFHSSEKLILSMTDTQATRETYPFPFRFSIIYELKKHTLSVTYQIQNTGSNCMYFGVGGHPGFRVPLSSQERFEDYFLTFEKDIVPIQLIFSEDCFVTGQETPFALQEGNILPLSHRLFDHDAIILRNAGSKITLRNAKSPRSITVTCADFPYLGLWHCPRSDAEYLCIEPWSSLPSHKGVITVLEEQEDLLSLNPKELCSKTWSIDIF